MINRFKEWMGQGRKLTAMRQADNATTESSRCTEETSMHSNESSRCKMQDPRCKTQDPRYSAEDDAATANITARKFRRLKRRYRFFQIGFFALIIGFGFTVYFNYDYWVFKLLIANNYILTDALEEMYATHIREENRQSFHRDFDRVVISVVTGYLTAINNDRYTYLYSPQEHIAVREREVARAREAAVTPLTEDTIQLFVPNLSRIAREFVLDNREQLAQYPNLILDLRGNSGGWLSDFHRIADLFVPRGAVLSIEETRMSLFSRTITSDNDLFFDFENIIILQNRRTASAAEGLIMALQYHLPNVTIIGDNTFGKGIGQVTIPLTGGYAVRATVLLVNGPDGENIHMVGIPPDIPFDPDIYAVDQALALLAEMQ